MDIHRSQWSGLAANRWTIVWILLTLALLLSACTPAEPDPESTPELTGDQQAVIDQLITTAFKQTPVYDEYELPDGETYRVYTIDLLASNAYLVATDQGMILVDAGLPFFAPVIEHYMEQIGRDDLTLIYITHAHIDHYGSAAEMRRRTGAPIAIHADDAESMAAGATELGVVRDWNRFSQMALPLLEPMLTVEPTEPDIILHDGERLDEYGVPATAVHTPGHTPGSSTLIVDGGVAFVGDLLSASGEDHVQQSYAFDWIQLGESLKKLATYHPQVLYTGHGDNAITAETLRELTEAYLKEKGIDQQ